MTHEEDEIQLLASRANLAVKVTYDSVDMREPHREVAIPRDQLDTEARETARAVLGAAGPPS
jgi:hypothetical protein